MDQKLEFIYFTIRKPSEYIDFHKHDCFELVYYISGGGRTNIGENIISFSANNFAVIEPNCIHDEAHDHPTDVLFIGFSCDSPEILQNGIYIDTPQRSIFHCLNSIKNEFTGKKKNYDKKINFMLGELLIELDRMKSQSNRRSMDFSYILGYIDQHYNQELDLQTLAKISGYSYHRFRHLFKEITGRSPTDYIISCRLGNAAFYLKNTALSVLEISQECGFSNESQFISMFRKTYGRTPGKYRINN